LTKKVEPKKDENWKEKIYETLEKTFNLKEFRANQFEIVETILKEKRDCFCLMPTGKNTPLTLFQRRRKEFMLPTTSHDSRRNDYCRFTSHCTL
jgi:hypothetical protein